MLESEEEINMKIEFRNKLVSIINKFPLIPSNLSHFLTILEDNSLSFFRNSQLAKLEEVFKSKIKFTNKTIEFLKHFVLFKAVYHNTGHQFFVEVHTDPTMSDICHFTKIAENHHQRQCLKAFVCMAKRHLLQWKQWVRELKTVRFSVYLNSILLKKKVSVILLQGKHQHQSQQCIDNVAEYFLQSEIKIQRKRFFQKAIALNKEIVLGIDDQYWNRAKQNKEFLSTDKSKIKRNGKIIQRINEMNQKYGRRSMSVAVFQLFKTQKSNDYLQTKNQSPKKRRNTINVQMVTNLNNQHQQSKKQPKQNISSQMQKARKRISLELNNKTVRKNLQLTRKSFFRNNRNYQKV